MNWKTVKTQEGSLRSRLNIGFSILVSALAVLGSLTACSRDDALAPETVPPEHVVNFGVVVPHKIYRSGLVSDEGFCHLYSRGLKTVINLRPFHSDLPWIPKERQPDYYHFQIRDHHPPGEGQMRKILEIVQDPDSWPVLIHCWAGKGRTGLVVAVIRYSIEGWPMEKALEEAKEHHDNRPLNGRALRFAEKWSASHKPGEWK